MQIAGTAGLSSSSVGDWRWLDNQDFPPSPGSNASSFQSWSAGEPNNNSASPGEDCAVFRLTQNGAWDDRNCGTTMSSICERE